MFRATKKGGTVLDWNNYTHLLTVSLTMVQEYGIHYVFYIYLMSWYLYSIT